jgi:hypothetical protein
MKLLKFSSLMASLLTMACVLATNGVVAAESREPNRLQVESVQLLRLDSPIDVSKRVSPIKIEGGEFWAIEQSDGSTLLQVWDAKSGTYHLAVMPRWEREQGAKDGPPLPPGIYMQLLDESPETNSASWALFRGGPGGDFIGTLIKNNGIYSISYVPR